jgi:glutathione S-transferase
MVVLFDLATRFDSRPSPFCWRAKLALAHKRLPFEARATLYSEIRTLGNGSFKTLPVIEDSGVWCGGSFDIAIYLDSCRPDRPTLFPNDPRRAFAEFVESWVDSTLHPQIFPLVALKIWEQLPCSEQDYFRRTRERRLSVTLEEAYQLSATKAPAVRASLEPVRRALAHRPFLSGESPAYVDYIVYGALKWYQVSSGSPLADADDPIAPWFDRIDEVACGGEQREHGSRGPMGRMDSCGFSV